MENSTLEKLKIVRKEVLDKFGKLLLFVVIKRADANLWDLVFAGDKLDQSDNLKTIADIVRKELDKNEMVSISKLVLLNSNDPFAEDFNSTFSVGDGNGWMTIVNGQINNVHIKEAYLFFSRNA